MHRTLLTHLLVEASLCQIEIDCACTHSVLYSDMDGAIPPDGSFVTVETGDSQRQNRMKKLVVRDNQIGIYVYLQIYFMLYKFVSTGSNQLSNLVLDCCKAYQPPGSDIQTSRERLLPVPMKAHWIRLAIFYC